MTAEIAVMNRDAVALAADSTVTISGKKTYHTTNKLFALSRFHPVGVMIYGSGELAGIPWETLIKVYRQKLGDKMFAHLKEYQTGFIDFLETEINEYNPQDHKDIFLEYAEDYLEVLLDKVDSLVETVIEENGEISDREIRRILTKCLSEHDKKWKAEEVMPFATLDCLDNLKIKYESDIDELVKVKLENHKITKSDLKKIVSIVVGIFSSKCQEVTGVVFSGFGDKDLFPRLSVCKIECIVDGKIKFLESSVNIDNINNTASIVPFAQTDIVATFMGGISEKVHRNVMSGMGQALDEYASELQSMLINAGFDKKKVESALSNSGEYKDKIRKKYRSFVQDAQYKYHIHPVVEAVQFLPKSEMAEVAEALVSITSFRQKISLEQESVGGAIDVAVVSKSDGFVWIKRKHYFEANLNPMFFSKYINERSVKGEK